MNVAKTDAGASAVPPWDDAAYPWDERPLRRSTVPAPPSSSKHDNNPTVEVVFALKKWEVVASDGKETLRIVANIELYWRDERMWAPHGSQAHTGEYLASQMTGAPDSTWVRRRTTSSSPRFYSQARFSGQAVRRNVGDDLP